MSVAKEKTPQTLIHFKPCLGFLYIIPHVKKDNVMELPNINRVETVPQDTTRNSEVSTYGNVVGWQNENDPANPFNWSLRKKWTVTSAAMYVCFIIGINSTAIASATTTYERGNDYWTICAWNAGAAFAPLAGLPLMEHFGVRSSFLVRVFLC